MAGQIPKEDLPKYVKNVREGVGAARDKQRKKDKSKEMQLAGLCLPKALTPILPVLLQGVLVGATAEVRGDVEIKQTE